MNIVHAYVDPRKHKDASCETCQFAKPMNLFPGGEPALLCTERMWDPKTKRCYLPREEDKREDS